VRAPGARACRPLLVAAVLALGVTPAFAQFQMPDPRQMAGIPRPVDDLPNTSISVRLIRGQLTNNIVGHPVELHFGNGRVITVNTDDAGRAQFDKLPPGQPVKFSAEVDGEHLESQEFQVPAQGGVRLMLVATDKAAAAAASAPAVAGSITRTPASSSNRATTTSRSITSSSSSTTARPP
jgi:hypothetical protein